MTVSTDHAYRECEAITRSQARNFFYGIRLLPLEKRRALSAVYALARRIDDIGDGELPAAEKLARLGTVRSQLRGVDGVSGALTPPASTDPVMVAVADAARRRPIPVPAFEELVCGCEADVLGTRYNTFDGLVGYCRQVAGSVGRLSLGVFGASDLKRASPAADALGVALQLTNILRDLVEDRRADRVYLPAEDLRQFDCTLDLVDGQFTDPPDRLTALIRYEADRAEQWYRTGLRLLPMLDRRSAACTGAMAGIYHRLLGRIRRDPLAVTRRRVSLPAWEKGYVAVLALLWRSA